MNRSMPREDLERACRQFSRRIAAMVMQAMAIRDMSFGDIAARLNEPEATVRRWFKQLADGRASDLRPVSEIFFALDCEFSMSLTPIEASASDEPDPVPEEAVAA